MVEYKSIPAIAEKIRREFEEGAENNIYASMVNINGSLFFFINYSNIKEGYCMVTKADEHNGAHLYCENVEDAIATAMEWGDVSLISRPNWPGIDAFLNEHPFGRVKINGGINYFELFIEKSRTSERGTKLYNVYVSGGRRPKWTDINQQKIEEILGL